ncbi:hypothetical protein QBC46DRAFT_79178 [Diplogelasinospora grovesii]|uniref:Uncharacterized protein n=1 Tax=Diplogelasinospora grovesii TaxID=303347 RepID=A0AAN6RYD4_9PEZI|nr:hypothetical protein QBC46DRAFT_79178 [Diplogelasinospora grovesii]
MFVWWLQLTQISSASPRSCFGTLINSIIQTSGTRSAVPLLPMWNHVVLLLFNWRPGGHVQSSRKSISAPRNSPSNLRTGTMTNPFGAIDSLTPWQPLFLPFSTYSTQSCCLS